MVLRFLGWQTLLLADMRGALAEDSFLKSTNQQFVKTYMFRISNHQYFLLTHPSLFCIISFTKQILITKRGGANIEMARVETRSVSKNP